MTLEKFYADTNYYESKSSKKKIVNQIKNFLKLNGSECILDLGCGTGAWSLPLLSHCANLTCIDLNDKNLEQLKRRVPKGKSKNISCYNAKSIDFLAECHENSYDAILSMWSLEHDTDPEKLIKAVYRVLKPNGFMVVLVPSADSLQLKLLQSCFYWFQAPWHTFIPSNAGLRILGIRSGFKKCSVMKLESYFNGWYWIRSLTDLIGVRTTYNLLRKFKIFVWFDIFFDKILDKFAHYINRPSHVFYIYQR